MDRFDDLPIRYDITLRKGSLFERTIRFEVPDGAGGMTLLNTAGYAALMQARTEPSAGTTVLSIGTHNARILTGIQSDTGGAWNIHLRIPATDTAGSNDPPAGFVGVYDLELEPPGDPGGRFALFYGTFRVEGEVSR